MKKISEKYPRQFRIIGNSIKIQTTHLPEIIQFQEGYVRKVTKVRLGTLREENEGGATRSALRKGSGDIDLPNDVLSLSVDEKKDLLKKLEPMLSRLEKSFGTDDLHQNLMDDLDFYSKNPMKKSLESFIRQSINRRQGKELNF